jgi:putative DNA primase/helicase
MPRPRSIPPYFGNIPAELQARPQWVLWRFEHRNGQWTKPPFQPDYRLADVTNPATWSSFNTVTAAYWRHNFEGVGFVVTGADPFIAWDFDHCLDGSRITDRRVAEYVARLASYTEVTPSGTGLRVLVRGQLPDGGRRKGSLEVYDAHRFVTCTGNPYQQARRSIMDRQHEVNAIHGEIFTTTRAPTRHQQAVTGYSAHTDDALLKLARAAKNGARFSALYDCGDWRGQGYPSQSEADLALCTLLAYWTQGDKARIDSLFRQSALMRGKWANRSDYRERTLNEAMQFKISGERGRLTHATINRERMSL